MQKSEGETPTTNTFKPEEIGEFKHIPHFNVQTASQSYSNTAAVLAGFAFAAVILVVSSGTIPHGAENAPHLRDWATIAFLLACFGCTLSAFVFSVVTGEEVLSPRTNMTAMFAASGFSVSTALVFWGIASLMRVYLDAEVANAARALFPVLTLLQPLFLCFVALDNIYAYQQHWPSLFPKNTAPTPTIGQWLAVLIPGYAPPVVAIVVHVYLLLQGSALPSIVFTPLLYASGGMALLIMLLSGVFSLIVSDSKYEFTLPPWKSGVWIFAHSLIAALLIILV